MKTKTFIFNNFLENCFTSENSWKSSLQLFKIHIHFHIQRKFHFVFDHSSLTVSLRALSKRNENKEYPAGEHCYPVTRKIWHIRRRRVATHERHDNQLQVENREIRQRHPVRSEARQADPETSGRQSSKRWRRAQNLQRGVSTLGTW